MGLSNIDRGNISEHFWLNDARKRFIDELNNGESEVINESINTPRVLNEDALYVTDYLKDYCRRALQSFVSRNMLEQLINVDTEVAPLDMAMGVEYDLVNKGPLDIADDIIRLFIPSIFNIRMTFSLNKSNDIYILIIMSHLKYETREPSYLDMEFSYIYKFKEEDNDYTQLSDWELVI